MELRNRSRFGAGFVILLGVEAEERLCVAVRGVWSIGARGELALVDGAPPVSPVDTFYGKPAESSIHHEADLGLPKRATDLALVGSALAAAKGIKAVEVVFRVGSIEQRAIVTGERRMVRGEPEAPAPFDRVPLRWELAYGGVDDSPADARLRGIELRNPLGRGYRLPKGSKKTLEGELLPQILPLDLRESVPVGFGFIGEHWLPRRAFGGTYDDAWKASRCPLLPEDFDQRFQNKAAPGLTAPGYLQGGETVSVKECTPGGTLTFQLPVQAPRAQVTLDRSPEPVPLHLDGVTVDCEAMQLRMLWRGDLRVHQRVPRLRRVDVEA